MNEHGLNYILVEEGAETLRLPEQTREVAANAFEGISASKVILPDGVTKIGSRAFADCQNLLYAVLPESLTYHSIAEDAFSGCIRLTILCAAESDAQQYAETHGIPFIITD